MHLYLLLKGCNGSKLQHIVHFHFEESSHQQKVISYLIVNQIYAVAAKAVTCFVMSSVVDIEA